MSLPQPLAARMNEVIGHFNAGRFDRADLICRQVLRAAPRSVVVLHIFGQVSEQLGRSEEAMQAYAQACRVDPTAVPSAVRLCSVMIGVGKTSDAELLMRRVVAKVPKSAEAWSALGFALKVKGQLQEALACQKRAVELNPKFPEGWCHLGLTYAAAARNWHALEPYRRALELNPKNVTAHFGMGQSLQRVYRLPEAIAEFGEVLKLQSRHLAARSDRLYAMQNMDTVTREELFAAHREYGNAVGMPSAALTGYDFSPDRRLRVGILSPDLRTHSCAYFLEPLLHGLKREEFELYLYHDHFSEDPMSERLKQHAAVWRNFIAQSNAAVERTIREDRPDILLDLAGHIASTVRLPLFAHRVAPVQITYLGYPDTTGVPAMDFRLTDAIADPVGEADAFATEKLVRFAPTAWCYQPPEDAPDVSAPPCAAGAPVTFGCFNSATKFTDSMFRAWAAILARVPGSRLLLKGREFEEPAVRDGLFARFRACGLPEDRVELLPRMMSTREHLAQYARIDIALDTFPYNGTTTTCEALWMGRPVVGLAGNRHAARVGLSLLTSIGRRDWVADAIDGYVERAVAMAGDPAGLASQSESLRQAMRASPLMDQPAQSEHFATALRACWKEVVGRPL